MGNEKIMEEDNLPTLEDLNGAILEELPTLDDLNGVAKKKYARTITIELGFWFIKINGKGFGIRHPFRSPFYIKK